MPDTTYEYLQCVLNGEHPIQRQNPQPGESEYYYINPNQNPTKSVNELQTTDVPNTGNNEWIKDSLTNIQKLQDNNLEALFDGDNVFISSGNKTLFEYPAMSGYKEYQNKAATIFPNKGPIPEGNWVLKYNTLEKNTLPYTFANRNKISSWGRYRAKLTPLMNEDERFGRNGFYLHGSYNGYGSAGCIDLGLNMPAFRQMMHKYGKDIPLKVRYKDKFGQNK